MPTSARGRTRFAPTPPRIHHLKTKKSHLVLFSSVVYNEEKTAKEITLRDYFIQKLETEIGHCWLNGDRVKRLPNNVHFGFEFVEGESLLIKLDMAGICGSSGSACTSGSLDPSHVLLAIGLPHEIAHGSLRLSLGDENTKEEMDYVIEKVKGIVERLRAMSPLYEDFIKKNK